MTKKKRPRRGPTSDLRSEVVSLSNIRRHPKNVRTHNERNLIAIARSLEEFGQRTPIVINAQNEILKGNGTVEAMERLGWSAVHVVRVTHLTEAQELAYMLADNRSGDLSQFDLEGLAGIMAELERLEMDLSTTGFDEFEVQPLLAPSKNGWKPPEPGEEPDIPPKGLRLLFTEAEKQLLEKAQRKVATERGQSVSLSETIMVLCRKAIRPRRKGQ